MKGIDQASNAVITIHLGLKIVWYLVGFTILQYLFIAIRAMLNVEAFAKDIFIMASKLQVAAPNDHSPVARKATDSGIEQLACKMSVRASEIM